MPKRKIHFKDNGQKLRWLIVDNKFNYIKSNIEYGGGKVYERKYYPFYQVVLESLRLGANKITLKFDIGGDITFEIEKIEELDAE